MPGPSERQPLGMELTDTEREREYSPSSRLHDGDYAPYVDAYIAESLDGRATLPTTTIDYGPRATNSIDLAIPDQTSAPGAPLDRALPIHIYLHGGYWQALSKHESFFLSRDLANRGEALAAVDYTLAPDATLSEIVDECCAAVRAVAASAADLGLDADSVTISGSSAGAHLAAMTALRLEPEERPAGLILVSGIYRLEPLIGTSINDAVGLDPDTARALSPLTHPLEGFPPSIVAYGDDETDEFKRQSRAMVDALTEAGVPVSEVELPDRNHFDLVFDIVPDLVELLERLTG